MDSVSLEILNRHSCLPVLLITCAKNRADLSLSVLFILFRIGEDIDVQAELDSDIYNPEYNARLEYREPVFSPSCILMLKVYTVDRIARNLCCVGYGFLPIFIEAGTTNPPSVSSSDVKVCRS